MPVFDSAGVPIHFQDNGAGPPAVLVHGFAASARSNWEETRWVSFLAANYRVIALDCRGHGMSGKPHESEAYGPENMGGDIIRLLDHLGIGRALLMGYSMGAAISLHTVLGHPTRFRALVLGGIGSGPGGMAERGRIPRIAQALLADDPRSLSDEMERQFRRFAEANRNDLKALAACIMRDRPDFNPALLGTIDIPVMVVIGTRDTWVGSADDLARAIPGAELVRLEGRDHLNAVGDKRYKDAVARFFGGAPA
ncbi:MAG: alpha/beta hydrolase [Candidatus Binataceae bacterium]|jgi:pimeloyl-ACP methyl ester carboxylesterase